MFVRDSAVSFYNQKHGLMTNDYVKQRWNSK